MTLVYVIKDWSFPDLLRQTPDGKGIWENIRFTLDPVESCDYVIVLNRVPQTTTVICPPHHIWAIIQEPPVKEYRWLRQGFSQFYRVYSPDETLQGEKYISSQPALPWWVGKSYDELKNSPVPDKPHTLSWITSNAMGRMGHQHRMRFLKRIEGRITFDLWGKGFTRIDDKWDGLAPYRYALAIENHSGPFYWSEKLIDCLLSWTMPIYYGCTNIDDYFPSEAIVKIDIHDPDAAVMLEEVVRSNRWQRNRDAIAHARELILDKYQFFPFVTGLIHQFETHTQKTTSETIQLSALPWSYSQRHGKSRTLYRFLSRLKRKLLNV